jgi:hypothetical protein
LDSTILDIELQRQLLKLCEFCPISKWKLKYRATIDGFTAFDFHGKCDGIDNTLTIIRTKSGKIFGGFTEKKWSSEKGYVNDPKAFIFSLINITGETYKAFCLRNGKRAIACDPESGPCFGEDIVIKYHTNFSNFGTQYMFPDLMMNSEFKTILAGSFFFDIEDIEIFSLNT